MNGLVVGWRNFIVICYNGPALSCRPVGGATQAGVDDQAVMTKVC
jgi:hypothetical protein